MTENNFIKKHGFPLNEVFDDYVKNATYVAGRPINVVYLDRETKFCLIVDEFHLSDCHDKEDDFALKIIRKYPDRFFNLSNAISINDFDLMTDFASEMCSDKLFRAIEAKKPMATFKVIADQLGLLERWHAFRDEYYEARLDEFRDNNAI